MAEGMYFIVKKKTHNDTLPGCVFSLSKKTFKTAVLRNKIKRQIRTIVKDTNKRKASVLVVPKKEIIRANYRSIKEDLVGLLEKI